jgi:hypothetical protein
MAAEVQWAASFGQPILMKGCLFGCPLFVESERLSDYWNGQSLYRFSRFSIVGLHQD